MAPNRVFIPPLEELARQWRTAPVAPLPLHPHHLQGSALGTDWSLHAFAPAHLGSEWLRACIRQETEHAVARFSLWSEHSEITRFNTARAGEAVPFSPDSFAVLQNSLSLAAATDGAVDCTLGALTALWGFGPRGAPAAPPTPTPADIRTALHPSGWQRLQGHTDAQRHGITQPGGLLLDLNGIAKGWCVDQISSRLCRECVTCHLIELGGEVKAVGLKPDRQPWWVELEAIAGDLGPRSLVALCDMAIATSGDTRRYLEHAGTRYAHTLDGHNGQPVQGVAAVSVLHPSAMLADAWATALTVLAGRNPAQALHTATQQQLAARLLLRPANSAPDQPLHEHLSPRLAAMLDDAP